MVDAYWLIAMLVVIAIYIIIARMAHSDYLIDKADKCNTPHFEFYLDGMIYIENGTVYQVHGKEHYYEIIRKWGHYGRK